jgi:DNA-binding MarR family transcriptional regulator
MAGGAQQAEHWTFLTNHAHVLLCVARDPEARLRDVALAVGITERATQRIVADLADDGYLQRSRIGRRNHYEVQLDLPFRHPVENGKPVSALLKLLA